MSIEDDDVVVGSSNIYFSVVIVQVPLMSFGASVSRHVKSVMDPQSQMAPESHGKATEVRQGVHSAWILY